MFSLCITSVLSTTNYFLGTTNHDDYNERRLQRTTTVTTTNDGYQMTGMTDDGHDER
jgi:hypothetical protein